MPEQIDNIASIKEMILLKDPKAINIEIQEILKTGSICTYYIEYEVDKQKDNEDCYYYALFTPSGGRLVDDGVELCREVSYLLEDKKTLFQRIGEIKLETLTVAFISVFLCISVVITYAITAKVPTELLSIISLALGYLMGGNKKQV